MMNIAYVILAHKAPAQLCRLIDRLDCPGMSFFIHIDKNTQDAVFNEVYGRYGGFGNVFFIDRIPCAWAEFSLVQATLNGINAALASGRRIDYVILLSGEDYPIKTNDYIKGFLTANRDFSFIHHFKLPKPGWHNGYYQRIPKGYSLPEDIRSLYGGSQWWCLTKECAEYIVRYAESNPAYIDYCRQLFIPDEIFFQTIVMNSFFKSSVICNGLRYIDWSGAMRAQKHPAVLDERYFQSIYASRALFARKLEEGRSAGLMDIIDRFILHK